MSDEQQKRNTTLALATGVLVLLMVGYAQRSHAFDQTHADFDAVLQAYTHDGWVAYGKLAKDRAQLDAYLASLEELDEATVASFTREQSMALWINAYNALTVSLILDNKEKRSIKNIDGAWDTVRFEVAGGSYTLGHIENEILRKNYPDPRLHMVLVCAARSCPRLGSRAFTADNLEGRLESSSQRFVRDAKRNTYDAESRTLKVSKIFEWYGADFVDRYAETGGGTDGTAGIRGFFATYLDNPAIASSDVTVGWQDYDWSLNGTW